MSLLGVICWGLWEERNRMNFEDKTKSHEDLCLHIYRMLFDWISIRIDFVDDDWYLLWCEEM